MTPEEVGAVLKAARDKVDRELPRANLWPCVVASVDYDARLASVYMHADAPGEVTQVALMGGFRVDPGDAAMVQFSPPQGLTLVAPVSTKRTSTASTTLNCGFIES